MKKIVVSILAIILVVVIVLAAGKNIFAKIAVEQGVGMVTGLKLDIAELNIGIIKTLIGIKDMKLYNDPSFQDKVMIDMPEIFVDYDLPAIIKGDIHLEEIRIDLKEFAVIKNENGTLNLDSLKVTQKEGGKTVPAKEPAGEKGKMPNIRIDKLTLKIGKVIYKDYSKGGKPSVQEFDLNISETYENIDNPIKLVNLIVVRALTNTTIAKLVNLDLGAFKGMLPDVSGVSAQVMTKAQETTAAATKAATTAAKEAEQTVQEAASSLQKTASGLTSSLKLPFGGSSDSEQQK